jgi:uncharacterized membrane protein
MTSYKEPSEETSNKWRNDPNNWVLGFFYYNKEDQRIFPPKKSEEMGSTINFANPKSVMALLGALAFFGMVLFFILTKNKK